MGQQLGTCITANADPELFYKPPGRESKRKRQRREAAALAYCNRCPVWQQCKADGDARGDGWAIYGRTTPEMRGFNATTGDRYRMGAA